MKKDKPDGDVGKVQGNVVSLVREAPQEGVVPNPVVVAMAKSLLERCESGEIQHLVMLGLLSTGDVSYGWSLVPGETPTAHFLMALGAMSKVKAEFINANFVSAH